MPSDKDHCCKRMNELIQMVELPLRYDSKFREYGIRVFDGGTSVIQIQFCPWCGSKLPLSRRKEWFEKLEALSIDPDSTEVPTKFQTSEWWQEQGH